MRLFPTSVILGLLLHSHLIADWPQFRGVNSAGLTESEGPLEFGPGKNERWHRKLGPGHSSPCISGRRLFVTSYDVEQKQLHLICVDRLSGAQRWRRSFEVAKFERGHPAFNPASSTPTTNGRYVVAYFGSLGIVCFDMKGTKQWQKRMPLTKSFAGNATSPAIYNDKVILYRGNYVDHFLVAMDLQTGKECWRVEQDEPFEGELACTASPIFFDGNVIIHAARSVQAFDMDSGQQAWITKCATTATSTPVIAEDQLIVCAWNKLGEPSLRPPLPDFETLLVQHDADGNQTIDGKELPTLWIFHRPDGMEAPMNGAALRFRRIDTNNDNQINRQEWNTKLEEIEQFRAGYQQHGVLSIPLNSEGLVNQGTIQVLERQGIPETPSPLYHDGFIYLVKNGGVLSCIDVAKGRRVAKLRTQGNGTHYASPILGADKLYCTAGDGRISVLSLGPKPRVLAVNEMEEEIYATPAIVDGILYVRTETRLYAFQSD